MFTMIKIMEKTKYNIKDIAKTKGMTIYGYVEYLVNKDMSITGKENRKIKELISELPYSFKYKIRQKFNGKYCPVCNFKMNQNSTLRSPSIQHNKPLSKGGMHEINNISVVCRSCNNSIKNKETGSLNNCEVVIIWEEINGIKQ